jgi:hypothetical protein
MAQCWDKQIGHKGSYIVKCMYVNKLCGEWVTEVLDEVMFSSFIYP